MKKKGYIWMAIFTCMLMIYSMPIKVNAICFDVGEKVNGYASYCGTPVCYTGNRTHYIDHVYERICSNGIFEFHNEYYTVKEDLGCCTYN